MNATEFDLCVAGGGVAGLTAAWHAALNGARVIALAGADLPGGLVANIGVLEGFPAVTPTSGMALAERLAADAEALGVSVERIEAEAVAMAGGGFSIRAGGRERRVAKVIAATGARLKPLEVEGAARFRDNGVLQCAWCNGGLFRGRQVVVAGAGDAAFQEAIHLARHGARVTIAMRGEIVRARRALVEQVAGDETITLLWSSEITAVTGAEYLTGVEIRDLASGATSTLACDAVFPYLGLAPNAAWLGELVARAPSGAVITDIDMRTKTPGLFAIGALRHGYRGRLTDAMGEASAAAAVACAELDALR